MSTPPAPKGLPTLAVSPSSAFSAATGQAPTLADLPQGSACAVMHIDEADEALAIRLKTMGLHEGRALRVLRAGDRMIVACGSTRIGLSAELARQVHVQRIEA